MWTWRFTGNTWQLASAVVHAMAVDGRMTRIQCRSYIGPNSLALLSHWKKSLSLSVTQWRLFYRFLLSCVNETPIDRYDPVLVFASVTASLAFTMNRRKLLETLLSPNCYKAYSRNGWDLHVFPHDESISARIHRKPVLFTLWADGHCRLLLRYISPTLRRIGVLFSNKRKRAYKHWENLDILFDGAHDVAVVDQFSCHVREKHSMEKYGLEWRGSVFNFARTNGNHIFFCAVWLKR